MTTGSGTGTPKSPEEQAPYVQDELDQDNMTHIGEWRNAPTDPKAPPMRGQHLGATDDEMVPVTPPMSGPADIVGERDTNAQGNETGDTQVGEEMVDPRDELTPG